MTTSGRTIARNATALMAAQVVTWSLTLSLTVVLPRALGAEGVGRLQIAAAVWGILAVFVTFGVDTLLVKSIAREPGRAGALLALAAAVRLLLWLPALGAALLWASSLGYPPETTAVLVATGVSTLVWQLAGVCQAALQGLERMAPVSLASVAGKAVNTGLCIALITLGGGALAVALAGAAAGAAALAVMLRALARAGLRAARPREGGFLEGPRRSSSSHPGLAALLRAGWPYLLSGLFLVGYQQVDVIAISLLADERTVGWYGAANQLFGTLLFIPTVVIAALFPALARAATGESDALPRLARRSFDLLLLVGVPVGLGLAVVADPLATLLFGPAFAPSGPVLAIFGVVLVLTYQNILIGQLLISADRQSAWTGVMAAATAATVLLDVLLVPWARSALGNGAVGGALSYIVTELGMLLVGLRLLPRGALGRGSLASAGRALLAGLGMAAVAWPLRDLPLAVPVVAGAAAYAALALLLGAVTREDRALAAGALAGLAGRVRRAARPGEV